MSFVVAMVISDDCTNINLDGLREIYGISLNEFCNPFMKKQIDNHMFFVLNDENDGYFWNNWTPVGAKKRIDTVKDKLSKNCVEKYSNIVTKWELEFDLRYLSFEAQMYIAIIKYLKLNCNIRKVGIVGFVVNFEHDKYQFPLLEKKVLQIKELVSDTLYEMKENCIYYFE